MEIFVGTFTPQTTRNDVVIFLKSFARDADIHMIDQKLENGQRAYYAIADFNSDRLALKAIKKLSGKTINGEIVFLREYFHRNYSNERRAVHWRDRPWSGMERRNQERRKKILPREQRPEDYGIELEEHPLDLTDPTAVRIKAYSNMARKL